MENRAGGERLIKAMTKFIKSILVMLVVLLAFPAMSFAATNLHDAAPGTVITFSGKQWVILEQMPDGTTYVLLNSNDGDRLFDPDNTQLFNPADSNNIGYYLNNTFYNTLSQRDLIKEHSWDIRAENGTVKGGKSHVTAKIGLISYSEYSTYRGNVLPQGGTGYYWWTITPYSGYPATVCVVNLNGNLDGSYAIGSCGVRPALYLKSNILLSDANEVIGVGEVNPPITPTGLEANATAFNQVHLTWQANSEPDLAGYIIYRDYTEIARVGAGETSYIDSGLAPSTEYIYGIKAYNTSLIISDMSNAATVTTPKPPAPSVLNISSVTSRGGKVTWDAVSGADSYNIYLNGNQVYNTTSLEYELYDLEPETSYTVEVRTIIGGVESEPAIQSFTTLSGPAAPVLTATAISYDSIQLTWQAVNEPDLSGYIIYRDYVEIARVGPEETSYIDSGLVSGIEYTYGIMSYNTSLITSEISNAVTLTTLDPKPVLTAKIDNQTIAMSWTGTADSFLIMVNGEQVDSVTGNNYSYNVQPGKYDLQVIALIGAEQYPSNVVSIKASAFSTPGTAMASDILTNCGLVIYPIGGLLALALGLKASPLIVTAVKAGLLRKFF